MRIEKSEFDKLVAFAAHLPKEKRAAYIDQLKSYTVYGTDDAGNEVEFAIDITMPDEAPAEAAAEATASDATITDKQVEAIVSKVVKSLSIPPRAVPVTGGRIASRIEIPLPDAATNLKSFVGERNGMTAAQRAYSAGQWLLSVRGNERAKRWCDEHGIKVMNETTNTAGGHLVPSPFLPDLINLVNQYGVFRANARVVPMTADTLTIPRVTGRLSAYFANENFTSTSSDMAFDRVNLVARKLFVQTGMTNEVSEDAAISLADLVFRDIARAFAYTEDDCGFNGDGSATYGTITGIRSALVTINGVDDGGGLVLASGNEYSEITLSDLTRVVGRTPTYALAGAAWYCSPFLFNSVLQRLAYASGGVTTAELKSGDLRPNFLGYPVNLVEVMPVTQANSQVCALFGDLSLATTFGDRRQPTIFTSEHVLATTDAIYVRATERFDINCHDLGTSSAAGPIVGLITASS